MKRGIKFVCVPDLHGDHYHPETVNVIRHYIRDFKPKLRVCIGDIFDFRNLRKGCSDAEKGASMAADVVAGKWLLDKFKFTHLTLGNHDQRLWDEAENSTGLVQDYCRQGVEDIEGVFKRHGTEWKPYSIFDGQIEIGAALFTHGFRANMHAAKSTAEDFAQPGRTVFFGHTHAISTYKSIGGTTAHNIGCACQLSMEYNQRRPNSLRWEHGFAAGKIYDDHVEAWVFRPNKNRKWTLVTEVKDYVG